MGRGVRVKVPTLNHITELRKLNNFHGACYVLGLVHVTVIGRFTVRSWLVVRCVVVPLTCYTFVLLLLGRVPVYRVVLC